MGSVKGNIGHLEIVAFLASLSKVCSILESGVIPPNVNLTKFNPEIHWEEYNLRVPTEATPLPNHQPAGKPSLISMSSSGIGGSNGHVVLEGPPIMELAVAPFNAPTLLVAAGLSPRSAAATADDIVALVNDVNGKEKGTNEKVPALSTLYGRRSRQMTWRSFAVVTPGQTSVTFPAPTFSSRTKPPVVFVFSGQGPQHIQSACFFSISSCDILRCPPSRHPLRVIPFS